MHRAGVLDLRLLRVRSGSGRFPLFGGEIRAGLEPVGGMAEMESEGARPLYAAVVEALVDNHRPFLKFLELRVGNRARSEEVLPSSGLQRFGPLL